MEKEKNLFEDFTTLRWVKWTTRQPEFNGAVTIRWNGKYTSTAIVFDKQIMSMGGEQVKTTLSEPPETKIIAHYTDNQKELMEDFYWLEETIDVEAYQKHADAEYQKFLENKYPT